MTKEQCYSLSRLAQGIVLGRSKSFSFYNAKGCANEVIISLAYSEMKLILARIIFNFDLELVDKGSDWTDQEAYILWRKTPLLVKVKEASRR
jgi:hypothetical protein